jgi:hypothetical protein
MSDATITAGEMPTMAEASELQIELPAGEVEVSYPRGVRIKEVKLKGMRQREHQPTAPVVGGHLAIKPVHARRSR